MKVIGLGWSGAGKTTLLTRLIPHLSPRILGLRDQAAHHEFDVDMPGKDSWIHRQSGAAEVPAPPLPNVSNARSDHRSRRGNRRSDEPSKISAGRFGSRPVRRMRRRIDPVYFSTMRRRGRRVPAFETWSALFRASAICILLFNLAYVMPAMARGGHMHGMGGFGIHEGHGMGGGEGLLTPTYVLITVSKITDAEAFKGALRDLMAADTSLGGRLAMDTDKPVYWEGTAAEHVVMIQFDNPDQAQAWKNSDAFKSFDTELHRSSESTIQLVQGLPVPAAHGTGRGRRGRGFDQKAFEPNVKEYNQMLNKMHGICKGC